MLGRFETCLYTYMEPLERRKRAQVDKSGDNGSKGREGTDFASPWETLRPRGNKAHCFPTQN